MAVHEHASIIIL